MRIHPLAGAIIGGLLAAGCSNEHNAVALSSRLATPTSHANPALPGQIWSKRTASHIASLADRGDLVKYDSEAPLQRGAYTAYPIQMSEQRAVRAIAEGGMVIKAPDGHPIALKYSRRIEHADGNWTWVGRPVGATSGNEAVLTFGDKAVFASIPDGVGEALQITTQGGRTWMVEADNSKLGNAVAPSDVAAGQDFLPSPEAMASAVSAKRPTAAASRAQSLPATKESAITTATPATTVDLVLGYTTGFATRLGGQSQALTRLQFIVDIANQGYLNSKVGGQLRLVHAVQVDYPDATLNRTALGELSGVQCVPVSGPGQRHLPDTDVNCTPATPPASLQPLLQARQRYGADLVSLVRIYSVPENQTCGVAWLLGGGRSALDASSAPFGLSVVSDSSGLQFPDNGATCRDETLAHEIGHNMGLAHDRATAQGTDDTNSDGNPLDPEEYGRFADSFGYSTGSAAGNFYTIMAVPVAGQTSYRVFSNPRLTTCGGFACGVAGQADNARTLTQTFAVVAAFRQSLTPPTAVWLRGDFDGDGQSDILWRNIASGRNAIWRSANSATPQAVGTVGDLSWIVAGVGDFNGDGKSDILWRNQNTGANGLWKSANAATPQTLTTVSDMATTVAGIGDFNGDGKSDILWRNTGTGANGIWYSGNSATGQALATVTNVSWTIVGTGDFDGDGKTDILWRNLSSGSNAIWKSGNSATIQTFTAVTDMSWTIVGIDDFNGDGKADILWRNINTGSDALWLSGNSATSYTLRLEPDMAWTIAGTGDFDNDGKADILWRNSTTGENRIWKAANAAVLQPVTRIADLTWTVAG